MVTNMEKEDKQASTNWSLIRLKKRFSTLRDSCYVKKCGWSGCESTHITNGGLWSTDDYWVCPKCGKVVQIFGGYASTNEKHVGYIDPNVESLNAPTTTNLLDALAWHEQGYAKDYGLTQDELETLVNYANENKVALADAVDHFERINNRKPLVKSTIRLMKDIENTNKKE